MTRLKKFGKNGDILIIGSFFLSLMITGIVFIDINTEKPITSQEEIIKTQKEIIKTQEKTIKELNYKIKEDAIAFDLIKKSQPPESELH